MSSSRRSFLRPLLPFALLTAGAAYALASWNWCGRWEERTPEVLSQVRGEGPLRAGAAKVALSPPYPVVVAGYVPPRPEASQAELPLHARALVLEAGGARVGVVSLELLLVTPEITARVRERAAKAGVKDVLVVATHTHSSFGGYDARWAAQLSGTGRYREASVNAVVEGASEALEKAAASMKDVTLEVGGAADAGLVYSRSGGEVPDGQLTRAVLRGAEGNVAEVLVFAGHATLIPRQRALVDPDYPGRLSALREEAGSGVTLFVQGSEGNASVAFTEGQGPERALGFARKLSALADGATPASVTGPVRLAFARVQTALPRPDSSRLVPAFTRAAGDNFLCGSSPREAEVDALALGPLELLSIPGEPTVDAGRALAGLTGATHVLGLANGYVGYLDTPEKVKAGQGESRRQYFGPVLLERLGTAARVASDSAGFSPGS
ncbi:MULTISPECIES: neutral/alkaline non-lysosomal ceramidase N-terminal domain-containing protein [unclassified Corallococcus]|uniref:neutral/alkaline non-lysosomal ceramidase N-terminal domain-containing protein n=1 Tax=unclassified Corallococcus TaxID=2685029 RepID=UPI001A8FF0AD|nr:MULTISPECIES: neutral/alkaline non-lysosomal ceramidase N-terminal domain-containing protein [unclassified Corallococcus]MBN9688156.1 neutral/alkaline non-lysosomal ceramidase N-terminal domain-containing protein [Corallococcus sp. NCSPR001]WAS88037.1 neutral/alkaline non-lysosomal ceramidase N-terminal domain-containing protein [Corallococcus sp. NCRR]